MNKFGAIFSAIKSGVMKHSPEILTGIGLAAMISSTVLAVRATPKAMELIDEKKKELKTEKIPVGEIVKTTYKCFAPSGITGVLGVVCIIGGCAVNTKRNAALVAAYSLTENAYKDYQSKALEMVGEKKEQAIREAVAKETINKVPVKESEVILTGKGDVLCYDSLSGRYFKSCMEDIRKVENKLNRRMRDENCISLNEFYDELGLREIFIGDLLVWHIDSGYIDIDPSTQLTEDERPCIVLNYKNMPKYYYDTSW